VYVSACDLKKYLSFDTTAEITRHVRYTCVLCGLNCKHILYDRSYTRPLFPDVCELERSQPAKLKPEVDSRRQRPPS